MRFVFLINLCLFLFHAKSVEGTFYFGSEDTVRQVVQTDIIGPQQESLYLGYRYTTMHFIAGITMIKQGYVLGIKGDSSQYYSLTPEIIQYYQSTGQLPTPLPNYELTFFDYFHGYSLWFLLLIGIIYIIVRYLLDRFLCYMKLQT